MARTARKPVKTKDTRKVKLPPERQQPSRVKSKSATTSRTSTIPREPSLSLTPPPPHRSPSLSLSPPPTQNLPSTAFNPFSSKSLTPERSPSSTHCPPVSTSRFFSASLSPPPPSSPSSGSAQIEHNTPRLHVSQYETTQASSQTVVSHSPPHKRKREVSLTPPPPLHVQNKRTKDKSESAPKPPKKAITSKTVSKCESEVVIPQNPYLPINYHASSSRASSTPPPSFPVPLTEKRTWADWEKNDFPEDPDIIFRPISDICDLVESRDVHAADGDKMEKRARSPEVFVPTKCPHLIRVRLEEGEKPGILVKLKTSYFPARVHRWLPAENRKDQKAGKDFFLAEMQGEKPKLVRLRNTILFSDKDIATCTLGVVWAPRPQYDNFKRYNARTRAPTPLPENDAQDVALDPTTFKALALGKQIVQIRSHILKILRESYAPAQWRIDLFYQGRRAQSTLKDKRVSGDYEEDELSDVIIPEIERFVLRADRWEGAARYSAALELERPRPTGSERYEALSTGLRRKFIQEVLWSEVVIQLRIRCDGLESLRSERLTAAPIPLTGNLHDLDHTLSSAIGNRESSADHGESTVQEELPAQSETNRAVNVENNDTPQEEVDPEQVLYDLAVNHLNRLAEAAQAWPAIIQDLRSRREGERRKRGLEEENLSHYEKRQIKLKDKNYKESKVAGRIRKQNDYRKMAKGVE